MKALHRLAENDIITRGVTVKIQQVGITKIRLTMPRAKMSKVDRNPWLAKMILDVYVVITITGSIRLLVDC